ncbi:MAG TPA: hypothetical protein VHV30_16800 [Polyangiaceae bacterium]|nr:hypothetical protein [Polyangiaceae bacterium]
MSEELWYVKLANGDVHRVTLDQLDSAFQGGHIDESTMVLAAGATQWTKLGDLAGLGDDEESSDETDASGPQASTAQADEEEPQYIPQQPAPQYIPPVAVRTAPVPVAQPVQVMQPMAQPVRVAQPVQAYVAPRPVEPAYNANSLRPMSMDLGDAADYDMPFQKKSRKGWAVAVLGLLVVAGAGSMAANRGALNLKSLGIGGSSATNQIAAASLVTPPPQAAEPTPPPAPAPPPPAPVVAAAATQTFPVEASPLNPNFTTRLNEDTKGAKLVATEKGTKAKPGHHAAGPARSGGSKSKSVFTTGGNKFDPLNSSI